MGVTALTVAVPMGMAATLAALRHWAPRTVNDVGAVAGATATVVLCAIVLVRSAHAPYAYWMGGWRPHNGVPLGIGLSIDPIGAGLATFAGVLVLAALLYSVRYSSPPTVSSIA